MYTYWRRCNIGNVSYVDYLTGLVYMLWFSIQNAIHVKACPVFLTVVRSRGARILWLGIKPANWICIAQRYLWHCNALHHPDTVFSSGTCRSTRTRFRPTSTNVLSSYIFWKLFKNGKHCRSANYSSWCSLSQKHTHALKHHYMNSNWGKP